MSISRELSDWIATYVDMKSIVVELEGVEWHGDRCSCPFGSDTHPSMYHLHSEDKNYLYCHHCGKAYSAVWFVSCSKHCSMDEAARWLMKKYSIPQPKTAEWSGEEKQEEQNFERVASYYCGDILDNIPIETRIKGRVRFWHISKTRDMYKLLKELKYEDFNDFLFNTTDEELEDAD